MNCPKTQPEDHACDPRIAFFDEHAQTWDTDGPDAIAALNRMAESEDILRLEPGTDLLEVGCGTGQLTQWLADHVRPGCVTAIDFSQAMLAKARAKEIDAAFRKADVCCDDLGSELFDVVFCFHCFPHFRDQQAALRNLTRTLRPTGRFIVMHLAGSEQINAFHSNVSGPVSDDLLPDASQWDALLEPVNLRKTLLVDKEDLFFLDAVIARH